jgi:hypothetical protein
LLGHHTPRSVWVTGVVVRTLDVLLPSHANVPLDQNVQLSSIPYPCLFFGPFCSLIPDRPSSSFSTTTAPPRLRASHSATSACADMMPPDRRRFDSTGDGRAPVTSDWRRMGDVDAGVLLNRWPSGPPRATTRTRGPGSGKGRGEGRLAARMEEQGDACGGAGRVWRAASSHLDSVQFMHI